jgi:CheY-like chemotaxis protein
MWKPDAFHLLKHTNRIRPSYNRPQAFTCTPAAPIRVLLIDDEEAFLVTAGEMLRQTGHSVTTAPTVAAALALLARRPLPSVVVLDLVLGEEDPRRLHEALVRRVQHMLYVAEYKRRQAAPGVKITRRNFGRDRRYPITNGFRDGQ